MNKTLKESREMKDSGIEWIGQIPKTWEVIPNKYVMKKIKDICIRYDNEDILSLTMNGVIIRDLDNPTGKMPTTFDGYQRLSKGNLLMCLFDIDVTPRCIGLINNNGLTSPAYSQFTLKNGNIAKYYYYYYLNLDFTKELLHLSKNLRNSLTENLLGAVKVPCPPIHEQQAIANYLDKQVGKIDELIVEQNQAIENWKSYKQSLITEAVTKGLNPNVEMKDSGIEWIGEIPKVWEVKKSKYLINFRTGLSITKKDFVESGYKTINYGQIHSKYTFDLDLTRDDLFKVSFDYAQSNPLTILKKGDFVFCDTSEDLNGCGNCVLVENTNEEVLLAGSHTIIGRLKEKSIPRYMAYLFKSDKVRAQIRANVVGIKVFSITQKILNNTFLIIPPLYEQQQIADFLDEKCSKIDQTIEQKQVLIQQLEEYKQSLIYECVTGKRCVL